MSRIKLEVLEIFEPIVRAYERFGITGIARKYHATEILTKIRADLSVQAAKGE